MTYLLILNFLSVAQLWRWGNFILDYKWHFDLQLDILNVETIHCLVHWSMLIS